ncbi:ABC transporter permease [Faecalitalea cylindroides]|uniref:ABC transporter permease n=1 Tax=Faecalitalea cylindroides TaxID=39483 RepID=UPI0022E4A84F|nr:ABC transporter permease [Faecalitalea cylindroides]
MKDNIRLSLKGIGAHKVRSFLTILGIIIGIASVIAIVSIIKGTNEQIERNIVGTGDSSINVVLTQDDLEYDMTSGIPSGISPVKGNTFQKLRKIPNVESVSLYRKRQEYEMVSYKDQMPTSENIIGIDDNYLNSASLTIEKGRSLAKEDREKVIKNCLLDNVLAKQLFGGEEGLGKIIDIQGTPFTVIGIVKTKKTFEPPIQNMDDYYLYHSNQTGAVYIPDSTWPILYQYDEPENVLFLSNSPKNIAEIGRKAEKILNQDNNNNTGINYKGVDLAEQAKKIQQLSQSTNMLLIWVAAISLFVGGIGVMNIMLVSVTERTREIGLKKAIGARKRAILMQFLTESMVLTSLGGIIGIAAGIFLAKVISLLNGAPVSISVAASILAVLFSMAIGIIFGLLPSIKAANLDPIDALRYE